MPDDAPHAPHVGGGIPSAFKQRVGPLPLWGWGLGLGGAIVGFVLLKRRGSTGAATLSGGDIPATIGSGSGVSPVTGGSSGGSSGPIDTTPAPPVTTPIVAPPPLSGPGDPTDATLRDVFGNPFPAGSIHIDPRNPLYWIDSNTGIHHYGGSDTPPGVGYWDSRGVWTLRAQSAQSAQVAEQQAANPNAASPAIGASQFTSIGSSPGQSGAIINRNQE